MGQQGPFCFGIQAYIRSKDGITKSGGNLEQDLSMIFLSRVSRGWQKTLKLKMEVGRLG
jgi:hypothetical protein